jgi:hypothetical protein
MRTRACGDPARKSFRFITWVPASLFSLSSAYARHAYPHPPLVPSPAGLIKSDFSGWPTSPTIAAKMTPPRRLDWVLPKTLEVFRLVVSASLADLKVFMYIDVDSRQLILNSGASKSCGVSSGVGGVGMPPTHPMHESYMLPQRPKPQNRFPPSKPPPTRMPPVSFFPTNLYSQLHKILVSIDSPRTKTIRTKRIEIGPSSNRNTAFRKL